MSSRALALAALERWRTESKFADRILRELFSESALGSADRAFTLELFYGTIRNLSLLDFWIAQLRSAAVEARARDLLRLGLYQLLLLGTPEHAAVFETVALANSRRRGLINALLRRALREKSQLLEAAAQQPLALKFSHPDFLVEKWSRQFGEASAADLCRWNNQPARVYLRVNSLKIATGEFLEKYMGSVLLEGQEKFVTLAAPGPALTNGDCYAQDPSTTIACELLNPSPGDRVFDACAAPGGKSAYLATMMRNTGELVAADRDEQRLDRLRGNLVRLGVTNTTGVCCDWSAENPVSSECAFDKILVDVPCSNTGVLRRRVDARWRLRPEDFREMPARQLAILQSVAPLLRASGSLVYSTCSLEPEENEEVVARFLEKNPNFSLTSSQKSLPFRDGFDGAYAARLDLLPND